MKRILVVAHNVTLRQTRVDILEREGYLVESVNSDDAAMALLETEKFDLILLGRNSELPRKGISQRLRERFPELLTLQVESSGIREDDYSSRVTDSQPTNVIAPLHEMLGDDIHLVPVQLPVRNEYPLSPEAD